jgi:hypothetical protein
VIELTVIVGLLVLLLALVLVGWRAERRQPNPDLVELVALVDRLCQRIQAPSQAVFEHTAAHPPPPTHEQAPSAVDPNDDEDFWESREELAERLMTEERDATRTANTG